MTGADCTASRTLRRYVKHMKLRVLLTFLCYNGSIRYLLKMYTILLSSGILCWKKMGEEDNGRRRELSPARNTKEKDNNLGIEYKLEKITLFISNIHAWKQI